MSTSLVNWSTKVCEYLEKHHSMLVAGVKESRDLDPALFDEMAGLFLSWAEAYMGEQALPNICGSYEAFTLAVNFAQARYEAQRCYITKSSPEIYAELYGQDQLMTSYILGVFATNFLWSHHLELAQLFATRFIPRLSSDCSVLELGSGHGGWGLWALSKLSGARLTGVDISPTSISVAREMARGACLESRAEYRLGDALEPGLEPESKDAAISCFLVEHLPEPSGLFTSLSQALKPGGLCFLTGALTAAQIDHVYEFKYESELVTLAEQAGFRLLEARSAAPRRTLRGASYLPRVMALILQKRRTATW